MKFKLFKMIFLSIILTISSISNAGLITLTETQNQTVDFQNFAFSWLITDWAVGTSVDLTIELQGDLGQPGELASINAESVSLGNHGNFMSGLNGWTSLLSGFSGNKNQWRVKRTFTLTSTDVAQILNDTMFNLSINYTSDAYLGNGVHVAYGKIGNVSPYVKADITYSTTNVPEPSTLAIFALGMIGLASRRFKKQS